PHLRAYLRGELDRATAVEKAKTATRRYAKRQMTWIRHQMIAWNIIDAQDSESLYSEIFSIIVNSGLTGQD
ncbi:MAG TPA: tRNA (adenosine(37)-N6)-dimethylallyltransferase MiaA, partial [Alphaproteobacteria bacterium]|nr:tRNA (adenosine(37)-N6)-dimethylallyltransferase MiaA [Alphaproteobacteria bacterium]